MSKVPIKHISYDNVIHGDEMIQEQLFFKGGNNRKSKRDEKRKIYRRSQKRQRRYCKSRIYRKRIRYNSGRKKCGIYQKRKKYSKQNGGTGMGFKTYSPPARIYDIVGYTRTTPKMANIADTRMSARMLEKN